MEDKEFVEKIYGPYSAAWKLIKLLQHCSTHSGDWELYKKELDRYIEEYTRDNQFAYDLGLFICNTVEHDIRTINDGGKHEAQGTNEAK